MNKSANPEMIVLARESRGLTQLELAEMTDLTQEVISRYESGLRSVSSDHLECLADVLGYPVEFFLRAEAIYGLGSSGLYHRKRKTLPTRLLKQLIAKVNVFRFMVARLMAGVEIDYTQQFPQYDVEDHKGNVDYIAEKVRAAWKLPAGPVVDLIGAIENAGGIIHRTDFGTLKLDALVQWVPPTPPIILVNELIPADRLRFTLAHELGHLVMHDVPGDDIEAEADRFAAAFLMPARDIRPELERVTLPRLAQLKPYWRVSIAALIRRARDLGTITERQYRSLNEEMSRLGYKVNEPAPIPAEQPTLFKEIMDAHLNDLGYGMPDLAKMLGLYENELRTEYASQHHALRLVPPRTPPKGQARIERA